MRVAAGKSAGRNIAAGAILIAAMTVLTGCGQGFRWNSSDLDLGGPDSKSRLPVSKAAMPTAVQPYPRIEQTLYCIRRTGVLRSMTFVVGAFADSTGKINAVAPGATGDFIPQGGSASYITDALTKAGGTVVSTYFGAPTRAVPAQYAVNGIFNSLDFGTAAQADVQVNGIGPTFESGWAQLSLTIQLDEVATRVNREISMIERPVRYTELGATAGKTFGSTLVTGTANIQNQERLQLEAINGPIALGVADVIMKEFPIARRDCFGIIADLLIEGDGQFNGGGGAPTVALSEPPAASAAPPVATSDTSAPINGSPKPAPGPFGPTNGPYGVSTRAAGLY